MNNKFSNIANIVFRLEWDNEYQGVITYNIEIESDEGDISLVYCNGKAYDCFHCGRHFSESDCEECIYDMLAKDYFFKTSKPARK